MAKWIRGNDHQNREWKKTNKVAYYYIRNLECISGKRTGSRRFSNHPDEKRFTLEEGIRLSRGGLALWLTYLYHHRFEIVVNEERERERESRGRRKEGGREGG